MSVPTVILNRAVSRERLPLAFVRLLGLVRYVVQGGTMPARDSETHSLMDVSLSHDLAMLIANMLEDQLRPLQDSNNVIGDRTRVFNVCQVWFGLRRGAAIRTRKTAFSQAKLRWGLGRKVALGAIDRCACGRHSQES